MSPTHSTAIADHLAESQAEGRLLVPRTDLERRAIHRQVQTGTIAEPYPGMFADPHAWEATPWKDQATIVIRTYADQHPGHVFCLHTAAFLQGLWVPKHHVTGLLHVVGGRTGNSGRCVMHRVDCDPVATESGLLVTPLQRTALDCMKTLDFRNGLAVADSLLKLEGVGSAEATARFGREFAGHRGIRRCRHILSHADARSDNGGESYARGVMIENGVMLPELQVEVERLDRRGRPYRVDYLWDLPDGSKVAGELDGFEKTESKEMLAGRTMNQAYRAERIRESQVTALGIPVLRFTFDMAAKTRPLLDQIDLFGIPREA